MSRRTTVEVEAEKLQNDCPQSNTPENDNKAKRHPLATLKTISSSRQDTLVLTYKRHSPRINIEVEMGPFIRM